MWTTKCKMLYRSDCGHLQSSSWYSYGRLKETQWPVHGRDRRLWFSGYESGLVMLRWPKQSAFHDCPRLYVILSTQYSALAEIFSYWWQTWYGLSVCRQWDMRICFAKNLVGFFSTSFHIAHKTTNKFSTVHTVDIILSRSNKDLYIVQV